MDVFEESGDQRVKLVCDTLPLGVCNFEKICHFWPNDFAPKCQIEINESIMEKNYQLRIPKSKKCFTEPNLFKIRASKMTLLIQIFLIIRPNQQSLTYDEDKNRICGGMVVDIC